MSYRGRGRGGGYNNNNRNRNNPTIQEMEQQQMANAIPVEIVEWNGASAEEAIQFLLRKTKIRVFNYSVDLQSGILKGYVRSQNEAKTLVDYTGLRFAGKALRISKGNAFLSGTGGGPSSTIETLQMFLRSRYSPEMKMLDLSSVQTDPNLQSIGLFNKNSTTSKFFPALMKVAEELKLDVASVNLSNNNLSDLVGVTTLSQAFPHLLNLSLSNNMIKHARVFDQWRNKLNYLRELIVINNPFVNGVSAEGAKKIKLDLMRIFPRLVLLDGEVLRDESVITNNLKFGFDAPQAMFFSDDSVSQTATMFVTNFINLWDANRGDLMGLYQAESQFSVHYDQAHPHQISNQANNADWTYYTGQSRNLMRVSTEQGRSTRLAIGQEQIYKSFTQIPKTQHGLQSKPEEYAMEAWPFLPLNGIIITLHGCYDEVAPPENLESVAQQKGKGGFHRNAHNHKKVKLERRCFDRTFVVIPGANGSMIVASDMLVVRSYTAPSAFVATTNSQAMSPVAPGLPQPGQPTVNDLPPEIKANYTPIQQELLVKIVLETKLNLQYGVMLCEQSQWDYQQCVVNFKNSAGSLPPDAYI